MEEDSSSTTNTANTACSDSDSGTTTTTTTTTTSTTSTAAATTRKVRPDEDMECLQALVNRCSDEKVALATDAYDLIDTYIRQIDEDLRRLEEDYDFEPSVDGPLRKLLEEEGQMHVGGKHFGAGAFFLQLP